MEVRLIFIGDKFYSRSGTAMSSIYTEQTWQRYDWGFVSIDLQNGNSVSIRPATDDEMKTAAAMLLKRSQP